MRYWPSAESVDWEEGGTDGRWNNTCPIPTDAMGERLTRLQHSTTPSTSTQHQHAHGEEDEEALLPFETSLAPTLKLPYTRTRPGTNWKK